MKGTIAITLIVAVVATAITGQPIAVGIGCGIALGLYLARRR